MAQTFNSKEYNWAQVQVFKDGKLLTKITGIKYSIKKEKEYLYAKGEDPHAIQSGNKSYEGEITLLQSHLEAFLLDLAPDEDLTDYPPFTMVVGYVPKNSLKITTHVLSSVEYTEDTRETKQGDKQMEITLPIMFLGRKNA